MAPPMSFIQNPEFRRAFIAHVGGEDLDDEQQLQLEAYCYVNMRLWEDIHYQYRSGMLSESEWSAFRLNLKSITQLPAWRGYWERESEIYTAEFRREMETILTELAEEPKVLPKSMIHPKDERE